MLVGDVYLGQLALVAFIPDEPPKCCTLKKGDFSNDAGHSVSSLSAALRMTLLSIKFRNIYIVTMFLFSSLTLFFSQVGTLVS